MRCLPFVATMFCMAIVAREARSEVTYVSPGMITSLHPSSRIGFGSELSFMHYPRSGLSEGSGAYLQLEWVTDPRLTKGFAEASSFHMSLGPQFAEGPLGLEIGLDYRSGIRRAGEGPALGVRAAPYLSLGYVYVSVGLSYLPVGLEDRGGQGVVIAFTVGIKAPITLRGQLSEKDMCPHC